MPIAKKKPKLRPRVWYVTVGCRDPADDYTIKVKTTTAALANVLAHSKIKVGEYLKITEPARAPRRNRTRVSSLRKKRSSH